MYMIQMILCVAVSAVAFGSVGLNAASTGHHEEMRSAFNSSVDANTEQWNVKDEDEVE